MIKVLRESKRITTASLRLHNICKCDVCNGEFERMKQSKAKSCPLCESAKKNAARLVIETNRLAKKKLIAKYEPHRGVLYSRWKGMVSRCRHKGHKKYNRYGGRGITVCTRWHTYYNFCEDMGIPPFEKAHIDRIDNNGNYEPDNCRWVSNIENQYNRDKQHHPKPVIVNGEHYESIGSCAKILRIGYDTVLNRCNKNLKGFSWSKE